MSISLVENPICARLLQITDPHLGMDAGYVQSGINTDESLDAVLDRVAAKAEKINMLVATGDISSNGFETSYEAFAEKMNRTQLPFCWLPGNHDNFEVMNNSSLGKFRRTIAVGGWHLIMVNSASFDRVNGYLPESEIEAIAAQLTLNPLIPTLIFVHHQPINVGCHWLDQQKISNSHELFSSLGSFNNVKAIFCGHVHQARQMGDMIPVYSSPSTCFQFLPDSDEFAISDQPPGYRWIELYKNGTLSTGVEYLNNFSQTVDLASTGY